MPFEPSHAPAFKALNEAWISRHFVIEPKDLVVLDDPQGQVLDKGGRIFMAQSDGRPVGCCALIAMPDGGYELAKMAVDETVRGGGIGRSLMDAAIAWARQQAAPRLYLESNTALPPALNLYRSVGFVDLPEEQRPPKVYARVNVWMELIL